MASSYVRTSWALSCMLGSACLVTHTIGKHTNTYTQSQNAGNTVPNGYRAIDPCLEGKVVAATTFA